MSALHVHRIVTGELRENCYVVAHRDGDAVVLDPGGDFERIAAHVTARALRVHAVLNTHAHFDHLGAAIEVVEAYDAPFHLHAEDAPLLPRANFHRRFLAGGDPIRVPSAFTPLRDAERLRFGALHATVVHTPGHTPGSVCFEIGPELFTGDTISDEGIGRSDIPGGDPDVLRTSIADLASRYAADTTIRPGHGDPIQLGDALALVAAGEVSR